MKNSMLALAAGAGCLSALALTGDEIVFEVQEGAALTKRFTFDAELDEGETTLLIADTEQDVGMEGAQKLGRTVVVTDEYKGVEDGRPTRLERTFDELALRLGGVGELESELAETSVEFTWDAEAEEYEVDFVEGSRGDDELLERLREDLDFRGLLPGRAVETGDTWEVDPEALIDVLCPGGDLKLAPEEPRELPDDMPDGGFMIVMPELPQNLSRWLEGLDGEVSAEYIGAVERDELELAGIEFEFDVGATQEMSEYLSMLSGGLVEYEEADLEFTVQGEATLLWNLEAGHFHSLSLEGVVDVAVYITWEMDMGPEPIPFELTRVMSGEVTIEAGLE